MTIFRQLLTDVNDCDGGLRPVAFGLVVVGWLSFSATGSTESNPSRSLKQTRKTQIQSNAEVTEETTLI